MNRNSAALATAAHGHQIDIAFLGAAVVVAAIFFAWLLISSDWK